MLTTSRHAASWPTDRAELRPVAVVPATLQAAIGRHVDDELDNARGLSLPGCLVQAREGPGGGDDGFAGARDAGDQPGARAQGHSWLSA